MTKKYDEEEGVWRTVGGRRIFIRTGQSLSKAMKESGKFGNKRNKKMTLTDDEYKLYKQAKENPDSIDAMTENSTDWEALDRKYKDRYNTELYNKALKDQGVNKQISEADYREMSKTLNKEIASGLKKSIEMEKDNLERRKANGDSVENISNTTRNIHNMELELQQAQSRISSPRDEIMYHLKKGNFATAEKYIKEYGLEDEREEFMDGLNYKARQAYSNAQKDYSKMSDQDLKDELQHYRNMEYEMNRRLSGRYELSDEKRNELERRATHYESTKDEIRSELRKRKGMGPVEKENEPSNPYGEHKTYWEGNGKYQSFIDTIGNKTDEELYNAGISKKSINEFRDESHRYYRWFNDGDKPHKYTLNGKTYASPEFYKYASKDEKTYWNTIYGNDMEKRMNNKIENMFEDYKKKHRNSNLTFSDFEKWFK